MPKICYVPKKFNDEHIDVIATATVILNEYAKQGFNLTLRQLYYQFVARNAFPEDRRWRYIGSTGKWVKDANGTKNAEPNYKWLGEITNAARLAGLIDWHRLIDRTRELRIINEWYDPENILDGVARQYMEGLWETQSIYVEVWIEKDAQIGNFEGVCDELRLPMFSCRGYTSQSEMWVAAQRLIEVTNGYARKVLRKGRELRRSVQPREVIILHFGDHDPSGVDMTRDIEDRLRMFDANVEMRRLALTMDQINEFNPPPDPAKLTDSRAQGYITRYGDESWELDSMEPAYLADLVRDEVEPMIDRRPWEDAEEREQHNKSVLATLSKNWDDIEKYAIDTFGIDD